jgi:hypothetical protein
MGQVFTASRLFGDSFAFPASLELAATGVRYAKGALIGGNEELINYEHIASVRLKRGLFHTTMEIETSGGSAPIVIRGLRSSHARAIRDAIEQAQAAQQ